MMLKSRVAGKTNVCTPVGVKPCASETSFTSGTKPRIGAAASRTVSTCAVAAVQAGSLGSRSAVIRNSGEFAADAVMLNHRSQHIHHGADGHQCGDIGDVVGRG